MGPAVDRSAAKNMSLDRREGEEMWEEEYCRRVHWCAGRRLFRTLSWDRLVEPGEHMQDKSGRRMRQRCCRERTRWDGGNREHLSILGTHNNHLSSARRAEAKKARLCAYPARPKELPQEDQPNLRTSPHSHRARLSRLGSSSSRDQFDRFHHYNSFYHILSRAHIRGNVSSITKKNERPRP